LGTILAGAASVVDGSSGNRAFFLFVSILALIITTVLLVLALINIPNTFVIRYWPLGVSD